MELGRRGVAHPARRRAVAEEEDVEVTDHGLARGRLAADICGDARNDDGVNGAGAEDQFEVGAVEGAEPGLVKENVAGIDDEPLMEGRRLGAFVDDAFLHRWGHLAQNAHVRPIGPQHMAGMDDQNAGRAAHRGKAVDTVEDRQPVRG